MIPSPLHTGRLVLTPEDPYLAPEDPGDLIQQLREIGFAGERLGQGSTSYMVGDQFMKLVTFMGCSPAIQSAPSDSDEPFCHLVQSGPHPLPIFLSGRNTTAPRCEACRKRVPQWQGIMGDWAQDPADFTATCPHCGHAQNPANYDWRQSAGCGRYMLCVENIFPQEAVPSTRLLNELRWITGNRPWHYFYIQE
ncbi:MAG: hypothetical protein AB2541_15785 [Candidatus Thiodiazotropha sp.]